MLTMVSRAIGVVVAGVLMITGAIWWGVKILKSVLIVSEWKEERRQMRKRKDEDDKNEQT